jgi:hypothetical protein
MLVVRATKIAFRGNQRNVRRRESTRLEQCFFKLKEQLFCDLQHVPGASVLARASLTDLEKASRRVLGMVS